VRSCQAVHTRQNVGQPMSNRKFPTSHEVCPTCGGDVVVIWFVPDPENEPQLRTAHRFVCKAQRCELTAGAVLQAHTQRMAADNSTCKSPVHCQPHGAQRD
jgi:hypothetical protein